MAEGAMDVGPGQLRAHFLHETEVGQMPSSSTSASAKPQILANGQICDLAEIALSAHVASATTMVSIDTYLIFSDIHLMDH